MIFFLLLKVCGNMIAFFSSSTPIFMTWRNENVYKSGWRDCPRWHKINIKCDESTENKEAEAQHLLRIIHSKYEMMIVMEPYFRSESDSCSTISSCGPTHELCMRKRSISYCYPIVLADDKHLWFFGGAAFISYFASRHFLLSLSLLCNINDWL